MISISIIIPTHNRPQLLARAVRSALAELPESGELVVVDDGTETPAAQGLADLLDDRLRIFRNSGTRGAAGARNFGARMARADWLLFLDDDDEFLPGYPSRALAFARSTGCAAGYVSYEQLNEDASVSVVRRRGLDTGPLPPGTSMRKRICGAGMGFWIRKDIFLELGGFKTVLSTDEDTELTVRLAAMGAKIHYDVRPGVRIHTHLSDGSGGQLTKRTDVDQSATNCVTTYRDNASSFPPYHPARWFLLHRALRRLLVAGRVGEANALARAARPLPLALRALAYIVIKRARLKAG